jgi:hypothetical protein
MAEKGRYDADFDLQVSALASYCLKFIKTDFDICNKICYNIYTEVRRDASGQARKIY